MGWKTVVARPSGVVEARKFIAERKLRLGHRKPEVKPDESLGKRFYEGSLLAGPVLYIPVRREIRMAT